MSVEAKLSLSQLKDQAYQLAEQFRQVGEDGFADAIVDNLSRILLPTTRFTEEERRVLRENGAAIYLPERETINGQKKAGRHFWHVMGDERLFDIPARRMEVAIFPGPDSFFVPGSFNKTTAEQLELIQQDEEKFKEYLALDQIGMIRPEAAEVTAVVFQHFDTTRTHLFGKYYYSKITDRRFPYVRAHPCTRTNTSINESGSHQVVIGNFHAQSGLNVYGGSNIHSVGKEIGAVRWIVPQGSR